MKRIILAKLVIVQVVFLTGILITSCESNKEKETAWETESNRQAEEAKYRLEKYHQLEKTLDDLECQRNDIYRKWDDFCQRLKEQNHKKYSAARLLNFNIYSYSGDLCNGNDEPNALYVKELEILESLDSADSNLPSYITKYRDVLSKEELQEYITLEKQLIENMQKSWPVRKQQIALYPLSVGLGEGHGDKAVFREESIWKEYERNIEKIEEEYERKQLKDRLDRLEQAEFERELKHRWD